MLKIGIQPIGSVDQQVLSLLTKELSTVFKNAAIDVIEEILSLPVSAYDPQRRQWSSPQILSYLNASSSYQSYTRVLGVADLDAYVPGLNFVFGEAQLYGKFCIIYLPRLRLFIGTSAQDPLQLFYDRVVKEAVHELGHTFGLKHCPKASCVMHFSNSIFDTDLKSRYFCKDCSALLAKVGVLV